MGNSTISCKPYMHKDKNPCPNCTVSEEPKQKALKYPFGCNLRSTDRWCYTHDKYHKKPEQKACEHDECGCDFNGWVFEHRTCEHTTCQPDSFPVLSKNTPELASNPDNTLKDIKSLNTWEKQLDDERSSLWVEVDDYSESGSESTHMELDPERVKKLIASQISLAIQKERDGLKIGYLRQWLNEDRITDPKKMVTNEQIETMLGISNKGVEEK